MVVNKKDFLYGDLTYKINGALFTTQNELGRFAREKQYGDLFEAKLEKLGLQYIRELRVSDSGNIVDFLIEECIVVEFKSKPFLLKEDYFQIQRYLQALNLELGILVNFRSKYLQPKRILRQQNDLLLSADSDESVDQDYTMTLITKAREEVKETKQQFFGQTLTLLNGAFALIAALAWNEAVKALLDQYFKAGSGVYSRFIYAVVITLLVVVVTTRLSKWAKKFHEENKDSDTN